MYDSHTHTRFCKHAEGEPVDYAKAAWRHGLSGLMVTCHNPFPDGLAASTRMALDQLPEYVERTFQAQEQWKGKVDVRLGLEVDFFHGYEGWLEQLLLSQPFDYVLGAVHPQLSEFQQRFSLNRPLEFQRAYFRVLADAAESGLFDCLAHPDVVKIVVPEAWDPTNIMDEVCRALDRIARTGVALEVNTSGVYKELPEMNPFPAMLREMRARNIPVVIGSDAHRPERVGDLFLDALDLVEAAGYKTVCYFVNRQRQELLIEDCRKNLLSAATQAKEESKAC